MAWSEALNLAEMPVPQFLLVYGLVVAVLLAACRLVPGRLDRTGALPAPAVLPDPDPYELAYLRGGDNEVTRLALFSLLERGCLRVADQKERRIERAVPSYPPPAGLTGPEQDVFDRLAQPQRLRELFGSSSRSMRIDAYRDHLEREQLLTPRGVSAAARRLGLLAALVIVGLGTSKLGTLDTGLTLLIVAAGLVLLYKTCRPPRLSLRGRAYLRRLRLAFDQLRQEGLDIMAPHRLGPSPTDLSPARLLVVGLFGFNVLSGTPLTQYTELFSKAASRGWSAGLEVGVEAGGSCGCGGGDCGCGCGGGCGCG